jgi:hypothetical protein
LGQNLVPDTLPAREPNTSDTRRLKELNERIKELEQMTFLNPFTDEEVGINETLVRPEDSRRRSQAGDQQ